MTWTCGDGRRLHTEIIWHVTRWRSICSAPFGQCSFHVWRHPVDKIHVKTQCSKLLLYRYLHSKFVRNCHFLHQHLLSFWTFISCQSPSYLYFTFRFTCVAHVLFSVSSSGFNQSAPCIRSCASKCFFSVVVCYYMHLWSNRHCSKQM